MCGIAGLSQREPIAKQVLASASAAIAHRGPDSNGIYVSPCRHYGLAHTRLAILDLSSAGQQPMTYEDSGVVITFNGEIYNFRDLKLELTSRGYVFRTGSDTEVLLAGYLAWGHHVLERINGIFAFAIYDQRCRQLFLARDQVGVKPLYYAATDEGFCFASEIKALRKLLPIRNALDYEAISRYIGFLWSPGIATPLAAVKKLAPGNALIVENGLIRREWTFWKAAAYSPRRDWTVSDCRAQLQDMIDRCVHRQMISDAPLGAFLSGGLDSSAVVAAARRLNSNISCFTISVEGGVESGTADDLPYARRVAKHLDVSLCEVHVSSQAMCDNIARMVRMVDEPLADPAGLNVYFISMLAREHGIKVLLSGAGGDDVFTGYRRHQGLALGPVFDVVPASIRRHLARLIAPNNQTSSLTRRLARVLRMMSMSGEERIIDGFLWSAPAEVLSLMSTEARSRLTAETIIRPLKELLAENVDLPPVEKCLALEQRFFLADHNLIYTDKMSMAAGVETRVPLLDTELINFAKTIPVEWKMAGTVGKWIFKESQRDILPADIIYRPKTGFGVPLRRWLNEGLKELVGDLLHFDAVARRGIFEPNQVAQLLRSTFSGQIDGSYTLFALMCVELWCREFIDGQRERQSPAIIAG